MPLDNAHALVVGIDDYQHLTKLPRVKDAEHVAQFLADPAHCGYAPENVRLLRDAQATGGALRQALAELAQRCDKKSTFFLYFSGHGGRIDAGPHAGQYLLPVDAVYPSDADLARTAISGAELTTALNAIPARKVVIAFDCCHSGGIGQPRDLTTPPLRPGLAEDYYDALRAGRGRAILAASRGTEVAFVIPGADYGLFT